MKPPPAVASTTWTPGVSRIGFNREHHLVHGSMLVPSGAFTFTSNSTSSTSVGMKSCFTALVQRDGREDYRTQYGYRDSMTNGEAEHPGIGPRR